MARVRVIQNSFNAGEFSPLMDGRTDLAKYKNACSEITNAICLKQGGFTRRPGTRFVAEVKTSAKKTRLIPFIFSSVQAYILEIGDGYIRFYKDGVQINIGPPLEVATPYLEAELFDIHFAQSADVLYLAHGNHPQMKLQRFSDTSWSLDVIAFLDSTGKTALPFGPEKTNLTITPSATTGAITLTASSPLFKASDATSPIGASFRLKHGTTWGIATVTGFTSTTLVNATVVVDFGANTASDAYQIGAWSFTNGFPKCVTLYQQRLWYAGTSNNPDTLWGSQSTEYENYDAGTALDDEACTFTLNSNRVNVIEWIAPSRGLLAGTTGQEWYITGAGGTDFPITPSSFNARAETTCGSSSVSPLQINNAALFLQGSGARLREFSYNYQADSYIAPDMTLLSEHITEGGITQMDYQQEKNSIAWMIRSDGTLVGLTYERDQDVEAWHKHETRGNFESVAVIPNPTTHEDQTWVVVKRSLVATKTITDIVAVVQITGHPPYILGYNVTYHVVAHGYVFADVVTMTDTSPSGVFNGDYAIIVVPDTNHFTVFIPSTDLPLSGSGGFVSKGTPSKRYVEYLDTQSGFYGNLQVDAGLTYSGAATATLTGLSHLEGQAVDILASGVVYPSKVVSGGQVTGLSPTVTQAEVGLHFDTTVTTMRVEVAASDGTAQSARKRYNEITARVYKTAGGKVNDQQLSSELFTGDKIVQLLGWDRDGKVTIQQNLPLPLTVLAVVGMLSVND